MDALPHFPNSLNSAPPTADPRAQRLLFTPDVADAATPLVRAEETSVAASATVCRTRHACRISKSESRRQTKLRSWTKVRRTRPKAALELAAQKQAAAKRAEARSERIRQQREARQATRREPPPPIPLADHQEIEFRHGGWTARRALTLAGLKAAGFNARAIEAFEQCGGDAWAREYADEEGGWQLVANYCHNRWCKPCGNARALLVADNLRDRLHGEPALHIVLTRVHVQAALSPQIDEIYKHFKTLRKHALWKKAITGGAAFLQSHVCQDGCWHVHLHITASGKWLNQTELSLVWKEITGDSDNVKVSRIHNDEKIAREVCRYVARPADKDTAADPDKLAEIMNATRGRRLCFTFGKWQGWRLCKRPETPQRPIGQRVRLTDLLNRSRAGEAHATHILDVLAKRTCAARPPPEDEHYL